MIATIEPLVLSVILLASRLTGVPGPLIAAVIDVESSFNLHALGDHDELGAPHAFGPMQLNNLVTFAQWPPDTLLQWEFNIILGADYLKGCLDAFPRNKKLAIAAYRQGIPSTAYHGYQPAEGYVKKVLALEREYQEVWPQVGSKP